MIDARFEKAQVLVYDPVSVNRNVTRGLLHTLGFREIVAASTLDELTRSLRTGDFDLLFCELSGNENSACRIMQRIRLGEIAPNPFLVIIATAWRTSAEAVRETLNGGADDLIVRPFSTQQIIERLRAHIENRKGFVVTSEYVGPDRRKPSRGGDAPLIEVPNSLKMKTVSGEGGYTAQSRAETEISLARQKIARERLKRLAFQLGVLASCIEEALLNGATDDAVATDHAKAQSTLATLTESAAEQCIEGITELSRALETTLRSTLSGDERPKSARLARELALAVQVQIDPARDEESHSSELAAALEKIRSRGREY
ncbi:MAG: response regulator [Alphaproteobacteria bacterium]|nr:response regulator [Alphaproteobacteria bacterium]